MSEQLVLYTHPMSRGRIARWMLEEVGQPYDTEIMDYGDTMKSERYLAINPMGKVPTIRHGSTVVTETAAICAYLADAFPEARLAPPVDAADRGAYYRWLFFTAGPLEAAVSNKACGFDVPSSRRGMSGYGGSLDRVLDVLEDAVTGRQFLVGDTFTAADLYVSSQLGWGMMFGMIQKRAAFEAYVERHDRRPASARASAIDDALSAAHPHPVPTA